MEELHWLELVKKSTEQVLELVKEKDDSLISEEQQDKSKPSIDKEDIEKSFTKSNSIDFVTLATINDLREDLLFYFTFSIFSGEYVKCKAAISILKHVKNLSSELSINAELFGDEERAPLFSYKNELEEYVGTFLDLVKQVYNSIHDDEFKNDFFAAYNFYKFDYSLQNNYAIDNNVKNIFYLNVKIARFDFKNYATREFLSILERCKKILLKFTDQKKFESLYKPTLYKINYLLFKFDLSYQKEIYKSNFYQPSFFKLRSSRFEQQELFEKWITHSDIIHETDNEWKRKLESDSRSSLHDFKKFNRIDLTKMDFLTLEKVVKHCSTSVKDKKTLTLLTEEFNTFMISNTHNEYDKYVQRVFYEFICLQIYVIEISECQDLENCFAIYESFYSKSDKVLSSFYLEEILLNKFFDFTLKNNDLESDLQLTKLGVSNELLIKCENAIRFLKNKIIDFKTVSRPVFLIPFNQSFFNLNEPIEYKGSLVNKVFLSSTFVLPIFETDLIESELKYQQKFNFISTYFITLDKIKGSIDNIEKLNKDIKDKDFRSIEILGVFSAIIAFVAVSAPSFKFVDNLHEFGLFVLAITTAMFLLISLIFFTTARDKSFKRIDYFYSVVAVLLVVFFIQLSLSSHQQENYIKEVVSSKTDSIMNSPKVRKNIDSIIKINAIKRASK